MTNTADFTDTQQLFRWLPCPGVTPKQRESVFQVLFPFFWSTIWCIATFLSVDCTVAMAAFPRWLPPASSQLLSVTEATSSRRALSRSKRPSPGKGHNREKESMFSHLYIFNLIVLLSFLYNSWYLMSETDILRYKSLALGMFIMAKLEVLHQHPWIHPLQVNTSK